MSRRVIRKIDLVRGKKFTGATRRVSLVAASAAFGVFGLSFGSSGATVTPTGSTSGSSAPASSLAHSLKWIIAASAIGEMDKAGGSAIAQSVFNSPNTSIIINYVPPASLASWNANFYFDMKTETQLDVVKKSSFWAKGKGVLYDPEAWSATPLSEQMNVPNTVRHIKNRLNWDNRAVIAAPALDLMNMLAPRTSMVNSFISSNLDGLVASHKATSIDIQAQSLELNPTLYASFVTAVAAQIHMANPNTIVYAGLSTNPSGKSVTTNQLYQDVLLTQNVVSGYWLNIPGQGSLCSACGSAQPGIAIDLLKLLGA